MAKARKGRNDKAAMLASMLRLGGIRAVPAIREIRATLVAEGGNVFRAAERLGVSHRSLCRWREEHSEVDAAVRAARGDK